MALFFDPDQEAPRAISDEVSNAVKDLTDKLSILAEERPDFDSASASAPFCKLAEEIVDIFFSESKTDKDAMHFLYSEHMADGFMDKKDSTTVHPACISLEIIRALVKYQSRIGGPSLVKCYNRTIKTGDKLCELCQRVQERHRTQYPSYVEMMEIEMANFALQASHIFLRVGDKKAFAGRLRRYCQKEAFARGDLVILCHLDDVSDEELWQGYRKRMYTECPLACINCGKSEEEARRKHSQCSACMNALYCSTECQKIHWKQHKVDCKANSRNKKSTKR